ncbi:MAG: hypothetical protein ACI4OI_03605 [Gemmiger sp.]
MRRLFCLLAALGLLTGCASRTTVAAPSPTPGEKAERPSLSLPDTDARRYGSVSLPDEPTILFSVYLDEEGGRCWDDAGIAQTRQSLAVAVDWLDTQITSYGTDFTLYWDDGSNEELSVRCTVDHTFDGWDEGDDFLLELDELCAGLDTEALHEAYGTDRVGFLFFLPVSGASYTMTHYLEDGDWFYHEYSLLYRYDAYSAPQTPESPAVYAHEILHLYGAPDLYEDSADYFVTGALVDYVYEQWPDAIMQYTYNDDGGIDYDRIDKILCPLTAFRLGLTDTFAGLDRFPAVAELPAGTFAEGPPDAAAPPGAVAV